MKVADYNYRSIENFIYFNSFIAELNSEEQNYFRDLLSNLEAQGISCLELDVEELVAADSFAVKYQNLREKSLFILSQDWQMSKLGDEGFSCLGFNTNLGSRIILSFQELDYDFIKRSFQRLTGQPWIILDSPRCLVRELCLKDLDKLYKLYEMPSIRKHVEPLFQDRSKEADFQKSYIDSMYNLYELGLWLIFNKENDQLIGRAGIEFREYEGQNVIELGYMLADAYQGRGYAKETCQSIIEYIRSNYEYKELYCFIENNNKASLGLAKALGFEKIGTHYTVYMNKAMELVVYRIMLN